MAAYNLTSAKTGQIYKVNFDSPPSAEDVDAAISHFDAPALATKRLSENERMSKALGGTVLDPVTEQPVYSPEQQAQDLRTVGISQGQQNLQSLQEQVAKDELNRQTGALTSGVVGAASVPIGLTQIISELLRKSIGNENFQKLFPQSDQISQFIQEDIEAKAGANPLSASLGYGVMNRLLTPGMGGGVRSLAQGETVQGLKDIGTGAASNVVLGTSLRGALGEDTGAGDIVTDLVLGGLSGGRRPDLEESLRLSLQGGLNKLESAAVTPINITKELTQKGIEKTTGLFKRKEGDIFAKALDIPDADKAATKRLVEGVHEKLLPEIIGNADIENAEGLLNGAVRSLQKRGEIVRPTISESPVQQFNEHLGIDKIKNSVRKRLENEFSSKSDFDDAMLRVDDVLADFNKENALTKQRALNKDVSSYQKRLVDPKGQEAKAKDALRDVISDGIKDLLEARGIDRNVYRDMSGLIDIVDNLESNILKLGKREKEIGGTRLIQRAFGEDTPSKGNLIRGVYQTLKRGPKEEIDDLARSLFKKVKAENPDFKITPNQIPIIEQYY